MPVRANGGQQQNPDECKLPQLDQYLRCFFSAATDNPLEPLVASAIQQSLHEKLYPQGHQATEPEDGPLKRVMGMDVWTRKSRGNAHRTDASVLQPIKTVCTSTYL